MTAPSAAPEQTPELVFAGDGVLYVYFPNRIDRAVNAAVVALFEALRAATIPGIVEAVPAYRALMIAYDPLRLSDDALLQAVRRALGAGAQMETARRRIVLPVAYGGAEGPDLDVVARHTGLAPDEVVRRHAEARYDVFFLGFTPGFPFLGGMPAELATPRRAEPRLRVEAGSVGIAGSQTGIYPLPSPGGWRIIGRTPVPLCDMRPDAATPVLLRPGDELRFRPIDAATFARIAAQVRDGRYGVEMETSDDP